MSSFVFSHSSFDEMTEIGGDELTDIGFEDAIVCALEEDCDEVVVGELLLEAVLFLEEDELSDTGGVGDLEDCSFPSDEDSGS